MIIDSVQYYKIGYAADITGYTIQELKDMFRDQNIPGKEITGDIMFSMEDIKTIQKKRRVTRTLKQPVQKFSPPLISLTEAAERTGYKPSTLRDYVKSGKLPGVNEFGNISFTDAQIREIIRHKEQSKRKPVEATSIKPYEPKPVKKETKPKPAEITMTKEINPYVPKRCKKDWECAKLAAKMKNISTVEYLLDQARPDLEAKRPHFKALRE